MKFLRTVLVFAALFAVNLIHGAHLHSSTYSALHTSSLLAEHPALSLAHSLSTDHLRGQNEDVHEQMSSYMSGTSPSDVDVNMLESLAHSHRTSSHLLHEVHENNAKNEANANAAQLDIEQQTVADEFRSLLDTQHPHPHHMTDHPVTNIAATTTTSSSTSSASSSASILSEMEKIKQLRAEHQRKLIEARNRRLEKARAARVRLEKRLGVVAGNEAAANVDAEVGGELKRHRNNVTITKSTYDDRTYRFLKLDNGLQVVLVSDPNLAKAAAAMDVGNGFLSDPDDIPGMAHFLEHMLFLGTKKYPGESEYSDYIEAHGGYSNAYTAMENTNYYFDIQTDNIEGALDRFAQFFVEPLLTVTATQREMNAVDSEHSKNLLSDAWRTNRLLQELANTSHPYHKFGTGCSKTLDVMPHADMRLALLAFWKKHYHAGNLRLAVTSSHTVSELEEMVDKYFSAIRASPESGAFQPLKGTTPADVYPKGFLPQYVYVKTVEDTRFISLIFPIPSEQTHYRSQSVAYLRHFIERRDSNSLLKEYKRRGWITGVQIGLDATTSTFATIQMSFDLTTIGQHHVEEIIEAFFKYINVLSSKQGITQWRYDELASIANMTWQLQDKINPGRFMSKLANKLRHYAPEDLLTGGNLFLKYDPQHLRDLLKHMNVDNMIVLIGGNALSRPLPKREKWYNIYYDNESIPKRTLKVWRKAKAKSFKLNLPTRNKYIPKTLSVLPIRKNHILSPEIIYEDLSPNKTIRLWYSEDSDFRRPHGHVVMRLYAPYIYTSPRNYLLTTMYISLLEDQIDEDLYSALIAGFSAHLRVGTNYIDVIFYGYNTGLLSYAESVAKIMNKSFKANQARFLMLKEQLIHSYRNKKFEAPHRQSSQLLSYIIDPKLYSIYDMVRTLKEITFQDVTSWPSVLFRDMSLEGLIHGNVYPKTARTILDHFVRDLAFTTSSASFSQSPSRNLPYKRNRIARITEDMSVIQLAPNTAETNSAVFKYWQFGMGGIEYKLYTQLLALMSTKPIFHQLRTKEQLGYIVWSSADIRMGVYGFRVQVQSGKHTAEYLDSRVDNFIRIFYKELKNLTSTQFETYVNTLMGNKLEMPVSMAQQTSWFWDEIARQEYIFNRRELELFVLNHTEVVNVKGFHDFIDSLWHITLEPNDPRLSCERRGGGVMSVQIEGKGKKQEKPKETKATAAEKEDAGKPNENVKDGASSKKGSEETEEAAATAKKRTSSVDPPKAEAKPTPSSSSSAAAQQNEAEDSKAGGKNEYRSVDNFYYAEEEEASPVSEYLHTPDTSFIELGAATDLAVDVDAEHKPNAHHTDSPVLAQNLLKPKSSKKKNAAKGGIFGTGKASDNKIVDQRVAVAVKTRDGEAWLLKATQSTIHSVTDQMGLYPRTALVKAPVVVDRAKESDEPLQSKIAADLNTPPNARRIKSQLKNKKAHAEQKKARAKAKEIEKQAKKAEKLSKKVSVTDNKKKNKKNTKKDTKKNKKNKK